MQLSDLVFIALALGSLLAALVVLFRLARGRFSAGLRLLRRVGIIWLLYLAIVVLVSLRTPARILPLGEDQCFDDWCVAVVSVDVRRSINDRQAQGTFYVVTVKVSSRARGRAQAAPDADVHLIDAAGDRFVQSTPGRHAWESTGGVTLPLGRRLQPGESFETVRVFDVPRNTSDLSLVVDHSAWPAFFIIGDRNSLFHRPVSISLR